MKYQNDFVELDGTENWALHSTIANAFYCDNIMPGIFTNNAKKDFVICSSAQQNAYIAVTILTNGEFAIGTFGDVIRAVFKDTSCATAEAWKAKLAENHVQIAYQLASPETYATDPVDFDNAAGPLNVMTGGEVEVYNTSLVGERELNLKANINDVLLLDNKNPYTPTSNYNPATKKYVDDAMASAGTGDMLKNVYDTNNNGIVDNAEKVNGLTVQTAVPANAKFTDTTYGVVSTSANGLAPKLPGNTTSYLRGDGTWATISVPSGAVSGVKGNAESTYRTGNVNLTPANIGAIPNGGAASLTDELTINASGHPITVSNGNISIEDANISIVNGELNYDAGTY